MITVKILGCGSALPTNRHLPSAQVVDVRGRLLMLDCGEGVQLQLRHRHLNLMRVSHIFITHAHGDHCFGLPGLISTFSLLGRRAPLFIYGPPTLQAYLECVLHDFCQGMDYEVTFTPVDTRRHATILETHSMRVTTLPLRHRVPCCGYLIEEQPTLPHIRPEMLEAYGIPHWAINGIKEGRDWTMADGTVVPHARLTRPAEMPARYAYCTDTMPSHRLAGWVAGVDMLYHEATFAQADAARAARVGHSTAAEAAAIAREAGVGSLVIGHFSARYADESVLLSEAQAVFPRTLLAAEGAELTVKGQNPPDDTATDATGSQ